MSLRHPAALAAFVAGAILALVLAAVAVVWTTQRDQALPNTAVAGTDVGGLTGDEIRTVLADEVAGREDEPVVLRHGDDRWTLVPGELGYRIDVDATVSSALARGRQGLPGDVATRWRALRGTDVDLPLVERYDPDVVEERVASLAAEVDREEVEGDVTIDPEELTVEVTAPRGSSTVRQEETVDAVLAAFLAPGTEQLDLPVDTTPPPGDEAALQAVAAEAEEAIAEPLVLSSDDTQLTLERADLARLLELEPSEDPERPYELVITEDAVEEHLAEVASSRFDVAPVSASYSTGRTPPVSFDEPADGSFSPVAAEVAIEPGRTGRRFDPATAAVQLTELIREGLRAAEIRLEPVDPPLPDDRAEELAPSHLIGTFTTYFTAGQDRNTNIQLLADVIDGAVVLPDEQFSINEISGERSCDKGYVPAGTIVQGELVDTCGGGTSQFGTTTFNAAFFAGVQLDQWQAHSWYISRYPQGREATLSYPVLDVRFTNTTDGAILVTTDHTSSSVTVSLYGQPRAEQVTAVHGAPTDRTSFDTETRSNPDLAAGQEQVVQAGTEGFTVEVERIVALVGGGEDRETIRTVYVPQTRIVERGTR